MSDYTPTTEEVIRSYVKHASTEYHAGIPSPRGEGYPWTLDPNARVFSVRNHEERELAEAEIRRYFTERDRQMLERGWWEACVRIGNGESNLDIIHVYQNQNPYVEGEQVERA